MVGAYMAQGRIGDKHSRLRRCPQAPKTGCQTIWWETLNHSDSVPVWRKVPEAGAFAAGCALFANLLPPPAYPAYSGSMAAPFLQGHNKHKFVTDYI